MRVSRLSVFLITALMACATAREKKIVCYFSNWAIYRPGYGAFDVSRITPELCTHLVYSYAGLDPDGTVKSLDPNADLPTNGGRDGFNKFNGLRQRNPAVKTFLAIGGWSQGSSVFSAVAADYRKRAWFVNSAVNFARAHGFDGLSLDWQYPNQRGGNYADRENYVLLVKDLRLALDRNGMLLMATVGAVHSSTSLSYKIREMSEWLDTINLMTYDFHGSWDSTTGINSPLYSAAGENNLLNVYETVKWWLNQGAPAHKLVVGIPAYGRSFELKYMWDHAIGSPVVGPGQAGKYTSQPGFLGHNEILELLDGSTYEFDWTRIAAYAYYNKQWFSYENTVTITQKTKMIKELGLGGAMLYSIDTDDFLGNSGRSYPLLKDVNNGLLGYVPPTSSGVEPGTVDPYQCECQVVNEFLRDLYDCNVYYQCIQDIGSSLAKKKFRCQPQLVFDLTLNVCNWPNQVDCSYCRRPRKFSPDAIKNETTATIMSSF